MNAAYGGVYTRLILRLKQSLIRKNKYLFHWATFLGDVFGIFTIVYGKISTRTLVTGSGIELETTEINMTILCSDKLLHRRT